MVYENSTNRYLIKRLNIPEISGQSSVHSEKTGKVGGAMEEKQR